MVKVPQELISAKDAIRRLVVDIKALHDSDDHIGLYMAVNTQTGKADIIPIPTKENIEKLRSRLDTLPAKIQQAIRKNIPEEDWKATELIWAVLDGKPLP